MKFISTFCIILVVLTALVQLSSAALPFCGSKKFGKCSEDCRGLLEKVQEKNGKGCCCNAIITKFVLSPGDVVRVE